MVREDPWGVAAVFPPWIDASLIEHAEDLGLSLTRSLALLLEILKLFRPVEQKPR